MEEKERHYIINYKGKEILYHDHRGITDLLSNLKSAVKFIEQYKGNDVLDLANWTGVVMTQNAMDYLKSDELVQINKKIKKTAILGFSGIKKIFLNVYNKLTGAQTRACDTEEEAKEWLIKD